MKQRNISGRAYNIETKTFNLADISSDDRYQARLSDPRHTRAGRVKTSVLTSDVDKFADNPVLAHLDGAYYIVDGFARVLASSVDHLNWPVIEVDILQGTVKEVREQARWLSLTANNKHVDEKGYSRKELKLLAFELSQLGATSAEIANSQGCCRSTAALRVIQGKKTKDDLEGITPDPNSRVSFAGKKEAQARVTAALNETLGPNVKCKTFEETTDVMLTKHGIQLCVWSGGNDHFVKSLPFRLLKSAANKQPTNFLVLLYAANIKDLANTTARRAFDEVVLYAPRCSRVSRLHCEDLTNEINAIDIKAVRQFIKDCKPDLAG